MSDTGRDIDNYIFKLIQEEFQRRISGFDTSNYYKYREGLGHIFIMLTCSNAIRNGKDIASIENMPEHSTVINFYNDMALLRMNRLAEILEPAINHKKNILINLLLKHTKLLFVFMNKIEEDDLTKKEFFADLSNQIFENMSLSEFIEHCKNMGEDVAESESLAISEGLYQEYIQTYSPISTEHQEQDNSNMQRRL